jgi:hypothetical protein
MTHIVCSPRTGRHGLAGCSDEAVPLLLPGSSPGTSLPLPIRFADPVVDGHARERYQRIRVEVHLEVTSPQLTADIPSVLLRRAPGHLAEA